MKHLSLMIKVGKECERAENHMTLHCHPTGPASATYKSKMTQTSTTLTIIQHAEE